MNDLYFRFIQFSLGLYEGKEFLDGSALRRFDWAAFYKFAGEQTISGIVFDGVQRLAKGIAPPLPLLMRWLGVSESLKKRNRMLDKATAYVYRRVTEAGMPCCILKGQGNAVLYPNPSARTPGDVDVWVDASRADIRMLAAKLSELNGRVGEESLNHIELTVNGVAVELHTTPAIMSNPLHNRRMQHWLQENVSAQCAHLLTLASADAGRVAAPTAAFNAVYQLFHLYHHYFFEGVGLRQVLDYYYVLSGWSCTAEEKAALQRDLRRLGLWQFAGAMTYVLREVLAMPDDRMPAPPDARRGRLLLEDIVCGGNFGQYETRYRFGHGAVGHNLQRLFRDARLLAYYPAEALSEPFFRIGHFLWRMKQ